MYSVGFASWAAVLFFQNVAFTFTSRARNSASLNRHLQASIFSNGIWILSNMLMLGPMFEYLTGKHGLVSQALTGVLYTVSTVSGSLAAHYLSKKTEQGKNAVGASERYAQIPVEEWTALKQDVQHAKDVAGQAYDITVGLIPDAGIKVQKIGDQIVTTGMPVRG
jgi:hypothetical protein